MLRNKTALITGASRGLGLAIARSFWSSGANLVLAARSKQVLQELARTFIPLYSTQNLKTVSIDLADPNFLSIYDHFTNIDILVNNAAIQGPIGLCWDNNWQAWQTTLQINLLSPIQLCKVVIPFMIKQGGGKIINLSGGGVTAARPNFSAYATSKSALVKFSETLAEEVKPYHVDVNCVAPGVMKTQMMQEIITAGQQYAGQREYEIALKNTNNTDNNTMQRAVDLCAFLASSDSNGITGKLISAIWDPWKTLPEHLEELKNSDIYTLRRIVPKDRGQDWGEV